MRRRPDRAARTLKMMALGISTEIPRVCAVARVITVMVIAAPSILMSHLTGWLRSRYPYPAPFPLQVSMLIGMFAAELLVKKAVMALFFKHLKISGYGFLRMHQNTRIGFVTK